MRFEARDESGSSEIFNADTLADAIEQAREWLAGGEYGKLTATLYVHCRLIEVDADGEPMYEDDFGERVETAIEPAEPKCTEDEHAWQSPLEIVGGCKESPGVYGHGGGVTISEVCMSCGCERVIDTWATDSATGRQGLRSVEYTPRKYAAEVAK